MNPPTVTAVLTLALSALVGGSVWIAPPPASAEQNTLSFARGRIDNLSFPNSLVQGDFDDDGDLDLAALNSYGGTTVFFNTEGSFSTSLDSTLFFLNSTQVAGDLDGDGDLDLALLTAAPDANSASAGVALNDGNGTFAVVDSIEAGTLPGALTLADLKGDSRPELVTALGGTIQIIELQSNAQLSIVSRFDVSGGLLQAVTAGDFDGDGDRDLAIAVDGGSEGGSIAFFLNQGNARFTAASVVKVGTVPVALAVRDFNGDSRRDLAVANAGSDTVSVLLNQGNARFSSSSIAVGANPLALTAGDLDKDGDPDLAVANAEANSVSVLLNNGDGTFAPAQNFRVGQHPSSLVLGDFDGDGDADLAVANEFSGSIALLWNRTSSAPTP